MDLLSNFFHYTYVTLKVILILSIIITSILIAFKLYKIIYIKINEKREVSRFKRGVLLPKDLFQLTDIEFKDWCVNFLKRLEYHNIQLFTQCVSSNANKDIVCTKGDSTVYINCRKYPYEKKGKDTIIVKDIKNLLGAMISDKVNHGIIITTGFLSKEAETYLTTIPKNYKIEIIEGHDLIEKYKIGNYGYLLLN